MLFRRFASTASRRLPPTIRQLLSAESDPQTVLSVTGHVKSVRRQKRVAFAAVNDGSCPEGLQAVLSPDDAHALTNGSSVRLIGRLVQSQGKGQAKELQVDKCEVVGACDPEAYPIQKQALSTEYLRDHVHLRPRVDSVASMLRVRQFAVNAIHDFFHGEGFTHVHTPIITGNDCEGAGETFKLSPVAHRAGSSLPPADFFDRPAYLTVSSQLHLEAFAHAISRVYTLSPCFRAERSQTNRHLSEFWMLEAEWEFINRVGDVCDIVEDSIKHVLNHPGLAKDLDLLWGNGDRERVQGVLQAKGATPWTRMSYTEAVKELQCVKSTFEFDPVWGKPLQSEHERWLADKVVKGPVFVMDYPAALKPFYMRANDDGKTVACFDLLMPHLGELVGGSLREERVDLLDKAMEYHGLDRRDYSWYRDLRVYGGAPHGGFGLGFERLIGWMTGIENVRECIPFPRWAGRLLL